MPRPIENSVLTKKPEASSWLKGKAKEHYDKIMPLLIKDGVVCAVDAPVIESACELYADFLEAEKVSDKKSAIAGYVSIMSTFGVTYKARKMLEIAKKDKDKEENQAIGGLFGD